jgi:hypothetical protein
LRGIGIVFFILSFSPALSQRLVNHQSLYWLRYQNQLILSPKLYWVNEIDNRRFFNPNVENQFIFHTRLHFQNARWNFASGLTLSWIFAQKPEVGYTHSVMEIRPVVEASYELPIGKIFLQNRLRLDNRFFEEDQEKSIFKESMYVLRFRYRAQVRIPLKADAENLPRITLRMAYEIMLNHTKNTFDQNRIYITSDFYVSKNFNLEAGYVYIFQQRFGYDEFFERHVIRFSVLHRIALH